MTRGSDPENSLIKQGPKIPGEGQGLVTIKFAEKQDFWKVEAAAAEITSSQYDTVIYECLLIIKGRGLFYSTEDGCIVDA